MTMVVVGFIHLKEAILRVRTCCIAHLFAFAISLLKNKNKVILFYFLIKEKVIHFADNKK